MELIKRWKKYILWIFSIICVMGSLLTVKADTEPDNTYIYKINSMSLPGNSFQNIQGSALAEISDFQLETYPNVRVESATNEKKIFAGKMKFTVNTDNAWDQSYWQKVTEIVYQKPTTEMYKEENGKMLLSEQMTVIPAFSDSVLIGYWTDDDGIKYSTYYDLEIKNLSDKNFGSDIAKLNGATVSLDESTKIITFRKKNSTPPSAYTMNITMYPVFGKKVELIDLQQGEEVTTDGDNKLSKVDFATGDRSIKVVDISTGAVTGNYTLHLDFPWKLFIPSSRNYVITKISYTNFSGTAKIRTGNSSTAINSGGVKAGTQVTVEITPDEANKNKILSTATFEKISGYMSPSSNVVEGTNTFTFIMPNGRVQLPMNVTYKNSDIYYDLTGEVTTTNNGSIQMGTVTITNAEGQVISSAKAGTMVTIETQPVVRAEYEFEFTGWKATGLNLTDQEKQKSTLTFSMPDSNVQLIAEYRKVGTEITLKGTSDNQGKIAFWYPLSNGNYYESTESITSDGSYTDIVKKNAKISVRVNSFNDGYTCSAWKVTKAGVDILTTDLEYRDVVNGYVKYKAPWITVENDSIVIEAVWDQRITGKVTVTSSDKNMGTAEVVGKEVNYKDDPVTIIATSISDIYAFKEWKIIAPDQDTAAESQKITLRPIKVEGDDENRITRAQFFMIDEDVQIQAVFYKAVLSSENTISAIRLSDQQSTYTVEQETNNYTVELSSDKTKAEVQQLLSGNFTLTLEIPEYATAAFGDDTEYYDQAAWAKGRTVSGFELNHAKSIKVKAEDGKIQEYTLKFTWTANGEKEISALELFDEGQSLGTGTLDQNGTDWIVTLSQDLTQKQVNALIAKDLKLKLTIPSRATATFGDGSACGSAEWNAGQTVRITGLNSPHVITVTAEDDTTATYNLIVKWTAKGDKDLTAVELLDNQKNPLGDVQKNTDGKDWTITLSQNLTQTEVDNLFKDGFYLKLTISDRATAALEGAAGCTKEAWANGVKVNGVKVVILKLNEAKKLTVTAEDGSTKVYTIKIAWSPKPTSKEKDLTDVKLLDKDKKVIAGGKLEGTAWTVEIPEDTYTKQQASDLAVGGSYLKLVASAGAKIEQKDGYTDNGADLEPWSSGNITTNMTLNKPYTFTVIAENGSTKIYTITLSYPTEKPVLKAGTVTRSSDQEAKAVFSSTLAGKYYWAVVEQGEKEPNISTSYAGSTAKKGNNTVTLTSLEAGAKDLYIVVKSTDGEISDPLKIEIPAYDAAAKEYAIALNYPTAGGTLKASATKAKAGDKITITVTPKAGYKLTPGTLKYSESSSTGAVVNIDETTFTFTMPASEISISCTWTAESTDQPETTTGKIGAFVVNGVSGTVDNTTGLITVTLPNGTDLTSLAPVITISGAKSISPASGATVDLSSPVTYTLTLEDGTTKTYTVRAYVEGPSKSDQLWNDMLNNVDGSPDHSGSKTWWKKAKDLKKHNDYPEYW